MSKIDLRQGDCLDKMKSIPDGSVDMILTDPPYGTTACKWDSVIPFEPMWEQLKRIIKPNGAIVLTASQPFTSALVMSNPKMFKYEWIWQKNRGSNFASLRYQPMKEHESIVVFSKETPVYNPIKQPRNGEGCARSKRTYNDRLITSEVHGLSLQTKNRKLTELRHPSSVQKFNIDANNQYSKIRLHPTQKPVALLEYLIKTYTNDGETVLDFTMGSGSTGVAAKNLNRNFIGIELDEKYFEIAKKRIEEAEKRHLP